MSTTVRFRGRFCNCCHPSHGWCLRTGEGQENAWRIAERERSETIKGIACVAGFVALVALTFFLWRALR